MMELLEIKLLQKPRTVDCLFNDGRTFTLPCAYLRAHSPSAEMRSASIEKSTEQTDYQSINIVAIEPVGRYAVKLVFDDGHQSGLYTWDYLYQLGQDYVKTA